MESKSVKPNEMLDELSDLIGQQLKPQAISCHLEFMQQVG